MTGTGDELDARVRALTAERHRPARPTQRDTVTDLLNQVIALLASATGA